MRRTLGVIAVSVVSVLLAGAAVASGATRVVFTVDVESNGTFHLPDQIDAVCQGGSACGLTAMARLIEKRGWSGTFFLDVYEHRKWGETAMRNIAVGLQAAGHDVELHTHPQWAYDPARGAMHQYSLDEQTTIIRDGVRLLQTWTGRSVVAHRAGAYTADEQTLVALERNGVRLDSSLFWKDPDSRLDGLGLPRNLPAWHGRVAEIPVTVYEREDRSPMFGAALAPVTVLRKIDANWFINENEVRDAIDAAVASDIPVLVVFLHSFSFMGAPTGGGPVADQHAMDMFRAILDHVARTGLPVVTMRELAEARQLPASASGRDIVPHVAVSVDLPHYVWRRAKAAGGIILGFGVGIPLLAAGAAIGLLRRGRQGR